MSSMNFNSEVCRERYGVFNATFFELWACSLCYYYIFHGRPLKYETRFRFSDELVPPLSPSVPHGILVYDNLAAHVMKQHPPLCQELEDDGCYKLKLCCQNAKSCCESQINQDVRRKGRYSVITTNGHAKQELGYHDVSRDFLSCPSTWDGFACFQETPAGQTAKFHCPIYIDHRNTEHGVATKTCTENGTWWVDPNDGREWTDYTGCVTLHIKGDPQSKSFLKRGHTQLTFRNVNYVSLAYDGPCGIDNDKKRDIIKLCSYTPEDSLSWILNIACISHKQMRLDCRACIHRHPESAGHSISRWNMDTVCFGPDFKPLYIVGVTCNVISLACLIPACIIFLHFKQLRKQHRIRIHLNLFASFILTNVSWIGWDHAIFRNRTEQGQATPAMYQHVELCRMLYILTRYSWACNFFWMSLEGFHLYRLINHAFKTPKSIRHYYFIGWFGPCIPFCLYCFLRFWKEDAGCWIYQAGYLEWIVYGPNLMCIVINVAFLVNVLRILLTQLQTHPNEPSNYRRAFKATFILVPLFGIQLFLIVYRPYDDIFANIPYEIIAKIIGNSQGAAVAIVFCFFNSEVHSLFSGRNAGANNLNSINEFRSCTYSTTGGEHRMDPSRQCTESYPLKCAAGRNGFGGRGLLAMDSPILSINSRDGSCSDSSRIHMI